MADWEIKGIGRDPSGNILRYCGDEPFRWSLGIHDLVDDIEGGRHSYFVSGPQGERVEVVTVVESRGKMVRTDPSVGPDLIAQLPRCSRG